MSGLKCVAEDSRFWIDFAEKFDDGEHENNYVWRLATDWLAMYDLLKEINDGDGRLEDETLDKIRALIGGE